MRNLVSKLAISRRRHSPLRLEPLEGRALLASWAFGIDAGSGGVAPLFRPTIDPVGNTYVAGQLTGVADFDPSATTFLLTSAADSTDGFAARYNADGSLKWARRFGGTNNDEARAVAYDGGDVVVVGQFGGSADFTGDGIADTGVNGGGFIIKLDADTGGTKWFRTTPYSFKDVAVHLGEIYTTGSFRNAVDFDPGPGTFTLTSTGKGKNRSPDVYVQKLDANGDFITAWQLGGADVDDVSSLQVDSGGVYVLGTFSGTADFLPGNGAINRTSNGATDYFLANYPTTGGAPLYVKTFGGEGSDNGYHWSLGASAATLYVTGYVKTPIDLDPSGNAFIVTASGLGNDALVAAYTKTSGAFQWGRAFGTPAADEEAPARAAVDPVTGNVYVGADFYGTIDLTPGIPGHELTSAGDRDSLLVKFNAAGTVLDAWRAGGAGRDGAARVAGFVGDTIYVTGWISSFVNGQSVPATADFPTGHTLTVASGMDTYVMALTDSATLLVAATAPATVSQQSLSSTEPQPIVAEAFRRWQLAGASTTELASINVQVADLPGNLLGLASGRTVWLDRNAAGWGWFVDPTPSSDSEFTLPGNQGEQNRMDLLTAVMHELGHVLGYDHDADGVMADALAAGIRETALDHDHAASVDRAFQDEYAAESWLTAWLGEQAETRTKAKR